MQKEKFGLNANQLKIIAALLMLIDHIGYFLFPSNLFLRKMGRLAFPIFAYFISEGCRYTHNKKKYFTRMFVLGLICMAGSFVFGKTIFVNIFITFSLSILLIYVLQWLKTMLADEHITYGRRIACTVLCIIPFFAVYVLCRFVPVDYGFWGVMVAVFPHFYGIKEKSKDAPVVGGDFVLFSFGLVVLSCVKWMKSIALHAITTQPYSLLSLPVLALYNRQRGKYNMKYFFYIFYPLHISILFLIKKYLM
ncbi:MAG: TraX family protein [Clostridia bacterium]|nr:TraX family protein [Clostridia bacterium]